MIYTSVKIMYAWIETMRALIFLIVFHIAIFFLFLHPVGGDGDFFHHLSTGKYIVDHHTLPQRDIYTFTANGKPWVAYAWASGLVFYLLYSNFGPIAISLLVSTVATLTVFLLFFLLKTYKVSNFLALLLSSFFAAILSTRFPNRPEIFIYPAVLALLLVNRLKFKHPNIVWLWPVIILVWANVYGAGVLVSLFILFVIAIRELPFKGSTFKGSKNSLYLSVLVSCVFSLFNGYGLKSIFYGLFYIPQVAKTQGEWFGLLRTLQEAPADYKIFFEARLFVFALYLVSFIALMVLSRKIIKHYVFEFFLSLSLLVPFFAVREMPLSVLLSAPLFTILIINIQTKWVQKVFILSLSFLIIVSWTVSLWINPVGVGEDHDTYPPQLITYLTQHNARGNIYTPQQLGAFISFYFYPNLLVSYDTRDDLFIGSQVAKGVSREALIAFLNTNRVNWVIVTNEEKSHDQPLFHSPDWVLVFSTNRYLLYTHRSTH